MTVVGILVFVVGAYLIWQARGEVVYWLEEFFRILRVSLRQSGQRALMQHPVVPAGRARRNKDTLRLVGGFGLMFLGQILVLLDLAF